MQNHTILIADDSKDIRYALTDLLGDKGYRILSAENGEDTMRNIRDHRPAILFLDIKLPGINGYELCRKIKTDPDLKSIYVILLTAKGQLSEQERGRDAGADAYLVKPFNPLEVLAKVKSIMQNQP